MQLATQPISDVVIPVASSDTSEGVVNKSSLTFTSVNWIDTQTVTVTGMDDVEPDGDQPYQIVLGLTQSTDPDYDGLDPTDEQFESSLRTRTCDGSCGGSL